MRASRWKMMKVAPKRKNRQVLDLLNFQLLLIIKIKLFK